MNRGFRPVAVCAFLLTTAVEHVEAQCPRALAFLDEYPTYPCGQSTIEVEIGDFNGDGYPDLAALNRFHLDQTVTILINQGNGIFAPTAALSGAALEIWNLAVGDLDGDGLDEVVTVDFDGDWVEVYRNLGDGTFDEPFTANLGPGPQHIILPDLNGDGLRDLVAEVIPNGGIGYRLNLGDFTFGPLLTLTTNAFAQQIASADFDGDGSADLVTTSSTSDTLQIFLNHGDGSFAPLTSHFIGDSPISVCTADVNGDGWIDAIALNQNSFDISVMINQGDGTFADHVRYPVGDDSSREIAVGDFDHDGHPDLAVTRQNGGVQATDDLRILFNAGDGTFEHEERWTIGYTGGLAVGDLNGDGMDDIVVSTFVTDSVAVLLNQCELCAGRDLDASGAIDFGDLVQLLTVWGPCLRCPEDLDGSGVVDLADLLTLIVSWGPCT